MQFPSSFKINRRILGNMLHHVHCIWFLNNLSKWRKQFIYLFVKSFHPIVSNICQGFGWFLFWAGINYWPRSKSCFAGFSYIMIVRCVCYFLWWKNPNLTVLKSIVLNFRIFLITCSFSGLNFHCRPVIMSEVRSL